MGVQRAGVEVAGQNLANVSNPAYARQRVAISTSITIQSEVGPQGTGSEAVNIVSSQVRMAVHGVGVGDSVQLFHPVHEFHHPPQLHHVLAVGRCLGVREGDDVVHGHVGQFNDGH